MTDAVDLAALRDVLTEAEISSAADAPDVVVVAPDRTASIRREWPSAAVLLVASDVAEAEAAFARGEVDEVVFSADPCMVAFALGRLARRTRAGEARVRALVAHSSDVIVVVAPDGTVTFVGDSVERILGHRPEALVGRSAFENVHPEDRPRAEAEFTRAALQSPGTLVRTRFRYRRENDEWALLECIGDNRSDLPSIGGVIITLRDITERTRIEEEFHETGIGFRLLFENNPLPMWVYDRETLAFLEVNEAARVRYGYSREEFLIKRITDIRPAGDVPRLLDTLAQPREDALKVAGHWRHVLKNGQCIDVKIISHPMPFAGRNAMLVVAQDITERLQAEDALRVSEERLRLALDGAKIGTWHWNLVTGEVVWSQRYREIYGHPPDHPASIENFERTLHPDDRDAAAADVRRALATGNDYASEYRILHSDGSIRWIESRGRVFHADTGESIRMEGIVMDVSDRRRLEDQLRQAQKMEAIGQLTSGIAHNFNNLLTIVVGHADLLGRCVPKESNSARHVGEIRRAANQGAGLVKQLMSFGRKTKAVKCTVNLNMILLEISGMIETLLRSNIELRVEYAANLPLILADPGEIKQVILNLAVNARDAMPNGGTLIVRTEAGFSDAEVRARFAENRSRFLELPPQWNPTDFVVLAIADTGNGMDAATRARVFEPFFTTKGPEIGTGLGLATVYGFVSGMGGFIEVESEAGRGTTFRLYLPVARAEAGPAPPTVPDPVISTGMLGSGRNAMVVEDDASVRRLLADILESEGFTVLEAANGEAAIELARIAPVPLDLAVIDLVMPRMGGSELVPRLATLSPRTRVLVVSGNTESPLPTTHPVARINKPFTPRELLNGVRSLFADESPPLSKDAGR